MDSRVRKTPGLPADVLGVVKAQDRLAVLHGLLDTAPDPDFDRITALAAAVLQAPIALITLVDAERQWFKSSLGLDETETTAGMPFSAHAIAAGDEPMVVTDATLDPRFAASPAVSGKHRIQFYAGVPMVVAGARIGTLCVLDRKPHAFPSAVQLGQLKALAELAASLFTLKDATRSGAIAKEALAQEEKRRAIALDAASLASWAWDIRTDIIECDVLLSELFDLPRSNRLKARDILAAIDPRDVYQTETRFRDALTGSDDYFGEYRVKGIYPPRWIATRGRVIERDSDGKPTLIFGVNYDITERKLGDERQRLLLRELNHRVKNTLATVQALATQTVRHARQPSEFLEAFGARLQALGAAHNLLSDREWRGIGIHELVQIEAKPFDSAAQPRMTITGEDLLLTPDQAVGLGLILHELASNALQYGSLSVATGRVELGWKTQGRKGARHLVLTWRETGGPQVEPPDRHGFGSILIRRSLAKIISSAVKHEFRPDGVFAEISIPLEDLPK
ncbi:MULTISPECIES: HWE histidine kinase domain-containing protein [Mesorhizobium]|uniref:sensor histidine kinase n=1 Tax=Mesorhizobium TaxID=68287 RepID=UPI000FCADC0C|nr:MULTISPECIES: HWE histidine kinase domain-containing protein [Mesorhizobium]MDX8435483.1 HWE histidine kinase domain-containing protein [Mesorhizobium abyssinicae]RUW74351.1 GAF domain-containing protein [Mesorhizobium sp. M4B.F.Ca.ET.049.02.1.2]RVD19394.1 GAF domain-containing protein [Mesorhizobium sp. M4B.F.Ca.ET.017.02.2.1]TGV25594.1 GAF domain-containing protein [Mesorhizobium sp. M4B.F.Ca.ET.143.01.1.1]